MGIKNINQQISKHAPNSFFSVSARTFSGTRIAVDALRMSRAYRSTANNKILESHDLNMAPLPEHLVINAWLDRFADYIMDMYKYNILPVFVFDGKAPADKAAETEKRKKEREEKKAKIREITDKMEKYWEDVEENILLRPPFELIQEYKSILKHNSYTPYDQYDVLKNVIRIFGCPIIQAPEEAEKLCSSMCIDGYVSAVFTTDTDTLVYGAPIMITKYFAGYFDGCRIDLARKGLGLTHPEFVEFAILCGCDYNHGAKGIGPATALKLTKDFSYIEYIKSKKLTDPKELKAPVCRKNFRYQKTEELVPEFREDQLQINDEAFKMGSDIIIHYHLNQYSYELGQAFSKVKVTSRRIESLDSVDIEKPGRYYPPMFSPVKVNARFD